MQTIACFLLFVCLSGCGSIFPEIRQVTLYNKPEGFDQQQLEKDKFECLKDVGQATGGVGVPVLYPAGMAGLMAAATRSYDQRMLHDQCMKIKGYEVVSYTTNNGKATWSNSPKIRIGDIMQHSGDSSH